MNNTAQIRGWGADLDPGTRPGVPMERRQADLPPPPRRQHPRATVLKRPELRQLTPVFGTCQPPKGLSGVLRRLAYRIPDHRPSHWTTLMLADKVDVYESAAGEFLRSPRGLIVLGLGLAAFAAWRSRDRV